MKRQVRYIVLFFILFVLGGLWYFSYKQVSAKKATIERIENLPPIMIETLKNGKALLNDFSNDETKLLIYFNTHCDFCQFELEGLSKRLPEFENCEIVLFSAEPIDSLQKLYSQFHESYNVTIGHCSYDTIVKYFGKLGSPSIFIYGADNKLVKKFSGSTRIDELLDVIYNAKCKEKENRSGTLEK